MKPIGKEWIAVNDDQEDTWEFAYENEAIYMRVNGNDWIKAKVRFYKGHFYIYYDGSPLFDAENIYWDEN